MKRWMFDPDFRKSMSKSNSWPTSYVCPPLIILCHSVLLVCSCLTTISFFIMQLLSLIRFGERL